MANIFIIYIFIFLVIGLNFASVVDQAKKLKTIDLVKYGYLLGSGFFWILTNAISDISKDYNIALTAAKLAIITPLHFMNALWILGKDFPESLFITDKKRTYFIEILTIVMTLISIVLINSQYNIHSFTISSDGPATYQPGLLYLGVLVHSVLVLVSLFREWFSKYKDLTETQKKKIVILASSTMLVFISIGVGLAYLPAIGLSIYSPIAFVSLTVLLYVFNRTLFIKEFLIDLNKSLVQIVTILLISLLNIFIVETVMAFDTQVNYLSRILIGVIYLVLIYSVYTFVVKKSQVGIEDLRKEVLRFSSTTAKILNKSIVQKELLNTLKRMFPLNKVILETEYTKGLDLLAKVENLFKNNKEVKTLTPEILTEIGVTETKSKNLLTLLKLLIRKKISIIFPIESEGKISGIVAISGRELPLERYEYNQLEALRQNVSVAMSRANLYSTVSRFNIQLEKTVEEQTKEIKDKYNQLLEIQKRERDMIDIMGHELRTPMSIIRLQFSLLLKRLKENSIKRIPNNYVSNIVSAIERESRLINSLLGATKIDKDKLELNYSTLKIMPLINESFQSHLTEMRNKNLEGKVISPKNSTLWEIDTDKTRFLEVLDNLIGNAVKYTNKGLVQVEVEKNKDFYLINVKDTGPGIAKKELKKLGTKFYRAEQVSSSTNLVRPGGTGLGLYVSKGIIEKHGGRLSIESTLGKGSTFIIKVPCKQKHVNNYKKESVNIFERLGLKRR